MDALERLQQWTRKYYRYKLECGPNIQPGDGAYIELRGGGRTVCVYEDELATEDEDGVIRYPTLAKLIHHALDEWAADESPKFYRVFIKSAVKPPESLRMKHWHNDTYMILVESTTEAAATEMVMSAFPSTQLPTVLQIWERAEQE